MWRASLEDRNEARIVSVIDSKQKEDLKMYIRLLDYDDFQCYDLGVDGILSRIAHKIYANFHKPSWGTSQHHLFMGKITKGLFKERNDVAGNDKREIPNMGECLGG